MQDHSRSQWHRDTLLHCSIYVLYNQIDVEQIRRRIDQNSMIAGCVLIGLCQLHVKLQLSWMNACSYLLCTVVDVSNY